MRTGHARKRKTGGNIVRLLLALIVVVVVMLPYGSHAGVRFADLGFEVSGMVGDISPTDFNQLLAVNDAGALTWVYGFGAAAVLPIGERFRASVGSGYTRSKSGEGAIVLFAAPSPTGVPTPIDYAVKSVPLTGRVDVVFTNRPSVLTLGAVLEMNFVRVTRRIHEQPALNFSGDEDSESATIPGLSVIAGAEWPVNQWAFLGVGVGYRFAEGDVPLFQFPDVDYRFDLGGAFATLLIRVHPWPRVSEDR